MISIEYFETRNFASVISFNGSMLWNCWQANWFLQYFWTYFLMRYYYIFTLDSNETWIYNEKFTKRCLSAQTNSSTNLFFNFTLEHEFKSVSDPFSPKLTGQQRYDSAELQLLKSKNTNLQKLSSGSSTPETWIICNYWSFLVFNIVNLTIISVLSNYRRFEALFDELTLSRRNYT